MIAGISYTLAAIVVGVVVWLFASGSGGPQLPVGQTPNAADAERLREIRDHVAVVRGLDVVSEVMQGNLPQDELASYVEEVYGHLSDQDRKDLEAQTILLRLLHMIEPGDDLLEIYQANGSIGIAGFYDYEQKSLVVIADHLDGSLNEESTLSHEFTHALQDQRFNLDRYLVSHDANEGEYGVTLSCVVEGDASFSEAKYMEDVYGENWVAQLIAEVSANEELIELASEYQAEVPPAISRYVYFNYLQCANFAEAIWEDGGWDAVNALYENPPSTTEQVLHPERYLAGEEALPLELHDLRSDLGLGWRLAHSGAFGEFDVLNYLITSELPARSARTAAQGWAAGKAGTYTLGGGDQMETLLHVALLWDSEADYDEFRTSYGAALSLMYDTNALGEEVGRFESPGEYGRAIWDEEALRVDLLFGTDQPVVDRAESSLTSSD